MEDEGETTKESSLKHTTDQEDATETELRSFESNISAIKATSEEEEKSSTKETNSFRKEEKAGENNRTLNGTSASVSYFSDSANDTAIEEDESIRGGEENAVVKMTPAATARNEHSLRNGSSSANGSRREIKSLEKSSDATTAGGRRCQRPFRDIIGKREQRKEELEKTEGDLRQRLDVLECSVPAVMVWNIWRMAQGAPVCGIRRMLERQFKDAAAPSCRDTPSRHYDCRVREVEAERKTALKKVEEARALWAEKLSSLEERRRKLDEAKRIQQDQRDTMERLSEEARALREAMEKAGEMRDESCRYGECGDTQCKGRWLGRVSSMTSIESGDIRCLDKLQRLAEEEMIVKREIAELERREEAYMRTLQQADELWSKIEVDASGATNALQEQLDMKTAANQQLADRVCELEDALEQCRKKMAACQAELERLTGIEKLEVTVGRDDDVAEVANKRVAARVKVVHRPIGRTDDVATVKDDGALARIEVTDETTLARIEVADEETSVRVISVDADADTDATSVGDKHVTVKPDTADLAVDRQADLVQVEDAGSAVQPADIAYEREKFRQVREYLAQLGSLEELYKDEEPCAPDFICNDQVFSPTGMTDEELIALGIQPIEVAEKVDRNLVKDREERDNQFREELTKEASDIVDYIGERERRTNETHDTETERKVAEKTEEQTAEVMDAPFREVITPREIQERAANDGAVTAPNDVGTSELKKIEADLDTLDKTRTDLKQPNNHAVKHDTDILADEIDAHNSMEIEIRKVEVEEGMRINEIVKNEGDKLILKHLERNEIKLEEVPTEIAVNVKAVLIEETNASRLNNEDKVEVEDVIEKLEQIPQLDRIETVDVEEKAPYAKVIEIKEIAETPVIKMEEVKQADVGQQVAPTADMKKVEDLMAEKISPIIDLVEAQKFDSSDVVTVDAAKMPITDVIGEKLTAEETLLSVNTKEEEIKVGETAIRKEVTEEKIEIKEPTLDVTPEEIEVTKPSLITDTVEEKIEKEVRSTIMDVTEETIEETIQPITESPTLQEGIEKIKAIEQFVSDVEIPREEKDVEIKEKDVEIGEKPTKVIPPIEEELRPIEEKEISKEIVLAAEPTIPMVEDREKEVSPIEKKPEVEEKVPSAKMIQPEVAEVPTIERQLAAQPYYIVTKVEQQELLQIIHAMKPDYTERETATCCTESRPAETIMEAIQITQKTDVFHQAEIVRITARPISTSELHTQPVRIIDEYLKAPELKASTEIAEDRPEITGRKMVGRERLKDQSTVTTSNAGSQTDKTSRVSHDRVEREPVRVPTDELLQSIKIVVGGPTRSDTEREIRTINYRKRSDDDTAVACNCCLCGRIATPPSTKPRSQIQSQIDAKTATLAAIAFKRVLIAPKINRPIPYDRLCLDCKAKIQGRIPGSEKHRVKEIAKKISRENHIAAITSKSCGTDPLRRTIEKKNQCCLAKIPKRKTDVVEKKRKSDSETISKDARKAEMESSCSSCICSAESGVKSARKRNCCCANEYT